MKVFQTQNFKVHRLISVFDNDSEKLTTEYSLVSFDLSKFQHHFQTQLENNDPEMILEYAINPKDVEFLSKYLSEQVKYDFVRNSYFLSCYRAEE